MFQHLCTAPVLQKRTFSLLSVPTSFPSSNLNLGGRSGPALHRFLSRTATSIFPSLGSPPPPLITTPVDLEPMTFSVVCVPGGVPVRSLFWRFLHDSTRSRSKSSPSHLLASQAFLRITKSPSGFFNSPPSPSVHPPRPPPPLPLWSPPSMFSYQILPPD